MVVVAALKNIIINIIFNFSVLPLVWLVIFTAAFMVGLGPIPWILLGELFPGNDRPKFCFIFKLKFYT